jgi:hypothetical protein
MAGPLDTGVCGFDEGAPALWNLLIDNNFNVTLHQTDVR